MVFYEFHEARRALRKILPESTVNEYEIFEHPSENYVVLRRGDSSIIPSGMNEYEVYLKVNGKGISELFDISTDTFEGLSLEKAVELMELSVLASQDPSKLDVLNKALYDN